MAAMNACPFWDSMEKLKSNTAKAAFRGQVPYSANMLRTEKARFCAMMMAKNTSVTMRT